MSKRNVIIHSNWAGDVVKYLPADVAELIMGRYAMHATGIMPIDVSGFNNTDKQPTLAEFLLIKMVEQDNADRLAHEQVCQRNAANAKSRWNKIASVNVNAEVPSIPEPQNTDEYQLGEYCMERGINRPFTTAREQLEFNRQNGFDKKSAAQSELDYCKHGVDMMLKSGKLKQAGGMPIMRQIIETLGVRFNAPSDEITMADALHSAEQYANSMIFTFRTKESAECFQRLVQEHGESIKRICNKNSVFKDINRIETKIKTL